MSRDDELRSTRTFGKGNVMATLICPDPLELKRFAAGQISDQAFAKIETHLLSGCETCAAALDSCEPPADGEPVVREVQDIYRADEQSLGQNGVRRLGPYVLQELLGAGGMGQVWRATHTLMPRSFAVKIISPRMLGSAEAIQRFTREIQVSGELDSPHIVRATHADVTPDGVNYLVMDLIDGVNLSQLLRRLGPLPVVDACEIARQVAVGLQVAHQHGLVHRDIKPSNIMLGRDGVVRILDFGVARFTREAASATNEQSPDLRTGTGQIVGTPSYMAPEQRQGGTVDIRADLYSLGLTLCRLLYGGQEGVPVVLKSDDRIPPSLVEVLSQLVHADPAKRFSEPADVVTALAPMTNGAALPALMHRFAQPLDSPSTNSTTDRQVSAEGRVNERFRKRTGRWVSLIGVLLLLTGGTLFGHSAVLFVTGRGQLEVVVPDGQEVEAKLVVRRDQQVVEIVDLKERRKKPKRIAVEIGDFGLRLEGAPPGYSLETDQVSIRRGKTELVKLRFKPLPPVVQGGPKPVPKDSIGGSLRFRPRVSYRVGDRPRAIVSADFDGDGDLDLATANHGDSSVSVLTNRGDGTFGSSVQVPVGGNTWGLVAGDFDGDGDPDLATANADARDVAILVNTGGRFAIRSRHTVGKGVAFVATADLNGDGRLDLIATNGGAVTVSVLLGKGDATFSDAASYAVGNSPRGVTIADFNGDRIPDLAVCQIDSEFLSVLLGRGDGTFHPSNSCSAGGGQLSIVSGDFNQDGAVDLAITNRNAVRVLQGDRDGTFHESFVSVVGDDSQPQGLTATDLNEDGALDLLSAHYVEHSLLGFYGRGDGTFENAQHVPAGGLPVALVVADFDRDGKRDLAAVTASDSSVSILLRDSTSTTEKARTTGAMAVPSTLSQSCSILNGDWRIEGTELVQDRYDNAFVSFGDPQWSDYDFIAEVKKINGTGWIALVFRANDPSNSYRFDVGVSDNKNHAIRSVSNHRHTDLVRLNGSIPTGEWLKLRVRVRGTQLACFINDQEVTSIQDEDHKCGGVGLETFHAPTRFRNIKVTDPTGKVLFEGLPQLANVRIERTTEIVPNSEQQPSAWKYSVSRPDAQWFESDFDDSSWSEGLAPFGSGEPGIHTSWKTPQIWIRRWFTLPDTPLHDPQLFLYTDDDSTVYLNGVLAAQDVIHLPGYRRVRIRPEAQATLKPGRNHIAITCLDTGGGRFIDAGLVDVNWESQTFQEEPSPGDSTTANAFWRTEGLELVQSTNTRDCRIFFGDPDWENYDFSVEARRISGMEGMALMFGVQDEHRFLNFLMAGWQNTRQWLERIEYLKEPSKDNEPPRGNEKFTYLVPNHYRSLQANRWYKLKVEVRGHRYRCFIDDQLVYSFEDDKPARGAVGLRTWARYRFRNLRVTDPDGNVLWSGVPKLPAPMDSSKSQIPISGTKTPGVEQLDAVMLTAMDHPDSQALTIAIGHEGKLLYSRGYGWQDRNKTKPAPADMLIGTTRWVQEYFINAAIKRLERTGKLKWDDRLLEVLPLPSQVKIEDPRFRDITIRHLLEMTSGWGVDPVPTAVNEAKRLKLPEPYSVQSLLELIVARPLINQPGSKSVTCGFNHAVLKAIVVQISRRPFVDYVQHDLFAPLVVPEFAELLPNSRHPPRAAWNAGAAANPDNAGVLGIPFCASAPGLYQFLWNYSSAGDPQNGDGWPGGFNWHSHADEVSSSHAWLFWRGDKDTLEIAVLHNGPLKANYDWIREMDRAIERLKWLWLVR